MALAVRRYDIIIAAQEGIEIDLDSLSKEERALYDEIKQECDERRAQGLPQFIYELPVDAYDDVYEDVDIYSENFDEEVMKEVNKGE